MEKQLSQSSLPKKSTARLISADSRLVYKGFDIACAKPTLEEREGVSHHLIDIVEPEFDYSVGNFYHDAKAAINDILSRGKTPIIAGGTGLYFRVLLENYNLPEVKTDYDLRAELDSQEKEALLEELKELDPITYERVKDANKRRIVRALEVIKILDRPLSEMQIEKEPEYHVEWRMPEIESREWLYERINRRVDLMFEQGLIGETESLLKKHGRIKNIVSPRYQEIIAFLDGEMTLAEALGKAQAAFKELRKASVNLVSEESGIED